MYKKRVSRKPSGVHTYSHKAMKKCAMKMKQRKNDTHVGMFLMEAFYKEHTKTGKNDVDELRVKDS